MKVAFDAHPLLEDHKSGIGYCQYGFINTLIKQYPKNKYVFNFFNGKYYRKLDNFIATSICSINYCNFFRNSIYKLIWNVLPVPYRWFFRETADITHFFNYYLPPGVVGKTIVTVHDMTYKRFPETVRFKTRIMLDMNLKRSLKDADMIITVSEFSRQEILSYFPECNGKIHVVYNGVDLDIFSEKYGQQCVEEVKKKYNIDGDYFLYLGTLEPRKNIERLLESYSEILKDFTFVPKLVLAGGKGWMTEGIFQKVKNLGLQNNIIFTGYISDEDKVRLIQGAFSFLFPSIYEGFGMPPLEAMACGIPVLTSNISSLPEVVGDCAVLVDPFSIEDIKNGLGKLITDENLRKELSEKGIERAKMFSWDKVTEKLYTIYEELVK